MLIPDIKNCSNCESLIETITKIDQEIYYLSDLRRDNERFDLAIYVDLDKLDKLLMYKRILQRKLRNPNYICDMELGDIISKVKLLTTSNVMACFFKKKKTTTTTSTSTTTTTTTTIPTTSTTTTSTTTLPPTTSTTTTSTTAAPTTSTTTTTTTTVATTTSTTTTTTTTLHIFDTILTFDTDIQDGDQGVTATIAEIDPETEFQFDLISPRTGLPSNMDIYLSAVLFMVVAYPSDYEGEPFRLIDDEGNVYNGVFTNGTINF